MLPPIHTQEPDTKQIEARSNIHSAVKGSFGFIVLAIGLLPSLGVLILSIIATDGLARAILVVPAFLIVALLLWELWAIATLQLEVDEHSLHWRAAQRRIELAWGDIRSVAYTQNGTQIRLTTIDNKIVRLVTASLPQQEFGRIKQFIAERITADPITIAIDKHAAQLNVALSLLCAASFFAAYSVAKRFLMDGAESSLLSLWIGLYFFFIAVPLIPTLLVAGVYWLARRKIMRGTAWILGIIWLLIVGLALIAT